MKSVLRRIRKFLLRQIKFNFDSPQIAQRQPQMEAACVNFFATVVLASDPSLSRPSKMAEEVM